MKSAKTVVNESTTTVGQTSQPFQKRFVPVKCKNRSGKSVILMAEISVVNDVFLHRNGSPVAKGRLHWNAGYFLILKHASDPFGDDFPSKQAILGRVVIIYRELQDRNAKMYRKGSKDSIAKTFPATYWEELTVDLQIRVICKHLCAILAKKLDTTTTSEALDEPTDADIQELAMQQETPDDVASSTSSYETMVTISPFIAHLPAEADGSTSIHQTPYDETVEKFAKVTLDSAFPFNTIAGSF